MTCWSTEGERKRIKLFAPDCSLKHKNTVSVNDKSRFNVSGHLSALMDHWSGRELSGCTLVACAKCTQHFCTDLPFLDNNLQNYFSLVLLTQSNQYSVLLTSHIMPRTVRFFFLGCFREINREVFKCIQYRWLTVMPPDTQVFPIFFWWTFVT